jgi:hypothetical protein
LNKKGIINSVDGKTYHIQWEGSSLLEACVKNAFDLWIDGDVRVPRGNGSGAAAAAPQALQRREELIASDEDAHSESGSVPDNDSENGIDPGDLDDDGDGQPVSESISAAVQPVVLVENVANAAPNVVQPVLVTVERKQGQRVVETRIWKETEIAVALETGEQVWSRPPKLLWSKNKYTSQVNINETKTALQYYMLFQSPESLETEVRCTNQNLRMRPSESAASLSLTVPELLRKRGIRLSMILEPLRGGSVADYWNTAVVGGTFQQPRNFGKRMGMSKHRFEVLESCMQFCEIDVTDRWWPIRKAIERFNEHMKLIFCPGKWIVIDESGFWWLGKDGQWHHEGMPHVTKIIRKPRSVMAELKSLCDALTGIMIALELQEGKDVMATKEFACAPHSYPHHVALDLRLTKCAGLHGTGRVLVGDSYFSSVIALLRLHQYGLFFWGIVKTATALYPMRFLKEKSVAWDAPHRREHRGKHDTLVSDYTVAGTDATHKMAAIAWHDLKTKYIITNVGHTLAGRPLVRKRSTLVAPQNPEEAALCSTRAVQLEIPQPAAVADGFEHFSAIDMHNDYRQGILKMEEYYKTHSWWKRMGASLEALTLVNAYLAYKFDAEQRRQEPEDYFAFCHRLAYQLVHNPYLPCGRQSHRGGDDDLEGDEGVCEMRALSAVKQVDWANAHKKNPRKRCRECSLQCSHVCIGCSRVTQGSFVFICNPARKPKCFSDHVKHVLGGEYS